MGEIQKQSVKGTVFIYLGSILGFVASGVLFPRIMNPDQIGLVYLMVAYATIYSQFASLGFNSATTRMFSYFRNNELKHNGFLGLALLVSLLGFVIALMVFFLLKNNMLSESNLLNDFWFYIIPLILFSLLFNTLDNYNKVLFNAVRGLFLKEFLQKFLTLSVAVLLGYKIIDFPTFILLYVVAICLPTIIFIILLKRENQFSFKTNFGFIDKKMRRTLIGVSLFGIVVSATGIITINLDRIMIEQLIGGAEGLEMVGIYSICFFYGGMVTLPSRAVVKISSAFIADAWKNNDTDTINKIYYKSSLSLFIVGTLLAAGLWVNIENIMIITTKNFEPGRYVILFIALAYLSEMLAGTSASILGNSKKYHMQALFMTIMIVLIIVTNYIFIPKYGIEGAAFASLLSKAIYNLIRFIYLKIV
ncbi:MAG: oligosaccharide flippase family protein, partial [Bacteroidales bacterium]|nr:oligosaccharide flippase family protein [Bacteroidales bacterium]